MAKQPEPPSHAYIPGFTERHSEGQFDHIRSSVHAGMTLEAIVESDAFQYGLHYLEIGYFWEAHEVLEPVWLLLTAGSNERTLVQALIQFANAKLKLEMQRPRAAKRLCSIVRNLLSDIDGDTVLGLEISKICDQVVDFERQVHGQ